MATVAAQPLASTYKRYKAGTAKLVSWLSKSAAHCLLVTGRSGGSTTKLTTNDLIEFAERIVASKDPVIEISLEILDVAKDAITGRAAAAKFYAELAAESGDSTSLEEANATHAHFLKVLQRVFDVLKKEHKSRRPKRKKKMPDLPTDVNDLTNLYQHLDLEDPEPAAQTPFPSTSKPQSRLHQPSPPEEYELDIDEEEKSFAIYCLFKDLMDVRLHVKDVWCQYNHGDITFLTASKITESAMGVSLNIAKEFEEAYPELDTFDKVIDFIGAQSFYLDATYSDLRAARSEHIGPDSFDSSRSHTSDLLCMQAWRALENYRLIHPYTWLTDEQRETVLHGKRPRLTIPSHPFGKLLANVAFELRTTFPKLVKANWNFQITGPVGEAMEVVDDYIRQLFVFGAFRIMDIGHLAATQVYITMYDALDGDMSRGLQECELTLKRLYQSMSALTSHGQEMDHLPVTFPYSQDGLSGWYLHDGFVGDKGIFLPYSLLKSLPLLPVSYAYNILYGMQHVFHNHLSHGARVLAASYLYKGCQTIGAVKEAWPDMDFFTQRQNLLGALTRDGDGSLRSVVNCYGLALGLSLNQVKSNKVPRPPNPDKLAKSSTKCISACQFTSIQPTDTRKSGKDATAPGELRLLYEVVKRRGQYICDPVINSQFQATRKLTAVQLLQVAQEVIIEDEPHLNFDYAAFFKRCVDWLKDAAECQLETQLGTTRPAWLKISSTDRDLYMVVHSILWNAAMSELSREPASSTTLHHVGTMASQFIRSSGDTCSRGCLEISSGHLAEHLKPARLYTSVVQQDWITEHVSYDNSVPWHLTGATLEQSQERVLEEAYHAESHPDIQPMLQDGQKAFAELMAKQIVTPTRAAELLEQELVMCFYGKRIRKRPVVKLEGGVLSITTRPWTMQEITDLADQVDLSEGGRHPGTVGVVYS